MPSRRHNAHPQQCRSMPPHRQGEDGMLCLPHIARICKNMGRGMNNYSPQPQNTAVFAREWFYACKYAALVELACVFMRFAARAYAYLCRHLSDLLGERCGTFRRMARRAERGVACSRRSDRDCVCAAGWGINEKTGSRLLPVPRLSI